MKPAYNKLPKDLKIEILFKINLNLFSSQYNFVRNLPLHILQRLLCNFKNIDLHYETLNQYFKALFLRSLAKHKALQLLATYFLPSSRDFQNIEEFGAKNIL